jgi:hypothetical protein
MTHRQAGKLGGIATLERYGKDYYRKLGLTYGSSGGRPKNPTIDELLALEINTRRIAKS